jgi:hypothetical protein
LNENENSKKRIIHQWAVEPPESNV